MNTNTLESLPLIDGSETLAEKARGPLVELSQAYINGVVEGYVGVPEDIDPLDAIRLQATTVYKNPEDKQLSDKEHIEIPLDQQLDYVGKVRTVLGEQATFDLVPMNLEEDDHNLAWLEAISQGHWPVAVGRGNLEDHDRGNHHDALVYGPPEQAMLVTMAAGYTLQARQRQPDKDIIIPKQYGGSERGETYDDNFLGNLDHTTEGLGDLSPQTRHLLRPLLDETVGFAEAIKTNTEGLVSRIETYLGTHNGRIGSDLALSLGSLDVITQTTQNRHPKPDEIKIALYEVIKGYVRTAAKLRGETVPEGALDFWPSDERGAPMTITMEELLFELGGGDRKSLDSRL